MLLDDKNWYYFNEYAKRPLSKAKAYQVRTFSQRKEYECFLLASAEVMKKLKYEPEVSGVGIKSTHSYPYPVYCASLNSSDIQHILDKYKIDGLWIQNPTVELTYSSLAE